MWEASAEENAKALEALRRSHVRLTLDDVDGGEDELASRDRAYRFFSELLEYCSVRDVRNMAEEEKEEEEEGRAPSRSCVAGYLLYQRFPAGREVVEQVESFT